MTRRIAALAAAVMLAVAGAATAAVVRHVIMLNPGRCTTIHKTTVCARKQPPRTVTRTLVQTITAQPTTTAAPAPLGFSGQGDETLPDFTVPDDATTLSWTKSGDGVFYIHADTGFLASSSATSGQTAIVPGPYSGVQVITGVDTAWTITIH